MRYLIAVTALVALAGAACSSDAGTDPVDETDDAELDDQDDAARPACTDLPGVDTLEAAAVIDSGQGCVADDGTLFFTATITYECVDGRTILTSDPITGWGVIGEPWRPWADADGIEVFDDPDFLSCERASSQVGS